MLIPSDFYLLRMPHFGIAKLFTLNKVIEQKDIYSIKKILNDDNFLDAIFLSSRYFYEVALDWLNNENITYNSEDKVLISLYKYYIRICTRCTPYGLFAGFGTGTITNEISKITLSKEPYYPIFRADMLFLKKIKKQFLEKERDKILFYPNNSIYQIGKNLRYVEWNEKFNYEISEVENNKILNKILLIAKNGITMNGIISFVESSFLEIKRQEAIDYIESLIDSKLLVDSLPPYLTSLKDPLQELNEKLEKNNIATDFLKPIIKFQQRYENDTTNFNLKEISSYCNDIIGKNEDQLFQVDLKIKFEINNINKSVVEKLSKVAMELYSVTLSQSQEDIDQFYKRFREKFENEEIPLVLALDPQLGVGYGLQISGNVEETPLLDDIHFTYKNTIEKTAIPVLIKIIIEKYLDCFDVNSSKIIQLDEEDIKKASYRKDYSDLHDDYSFFGDIISQSAEDVNNLKFKFFPKAPFPLPFVNNVLSRFAYHDKELMDNLKSKSQRTSNNIIHAEIIHYPSDRVGNILLRPNFYDYEIPYITESSMDKIKIEINDIFVKIDNGKIILISKSLNKEIKPHLSSAYNYSANQLSIIRFLGDLQYHNKFNGFSWDWSIFKTKEYLPRVEYKNIILSEARWKVKKMKDISFIDFKKFINKMNIPRYCNFKESDNVLLINLEEDVSLRIIYTKVKKTSIYLYESFVDDLFISKGKEKYKAEFIFPLYVKDKDEITPISIISKKEIDGIKRDLYPGSEWTYFKIYCSHIFGDKILHCAIVPFLKDLKEMDFEWFYIRYEDPEPHIRLRIRHAFSEEILNNLNRYLNSLLEEGIVFSVQMDTYKREIERYGEKNIELSEKLFYYDSVATIKLISLMTKECSDENIRWKIGIVSLDIILDDFRISIEDRVILFESLYKKFLPEFVDNSNNQFVKLFKTSLDKQHRKHKQFLDSVLRKKDYYELEMFVTPYIEKSKYAQEIVSSIRENTKDKNELLDLLQSYVHMSLNRLFFTKARMHELIIYYLLFQTYNSILNRKDEK